MSEQDQGPFDDTVVERVQSTNGRVSGALGLAVAGAVLVLAALTRDAGLPLGVGIVAALGAVLVWASMLRPAVWTTGHDLVLRGMFSTYRVPLAAIERVEVAQVLMVTAGGRRFASPVVGYSARQLMKGRRQRAGQTGGVFSFERPAFAEPEVANPAPPEASSHQAFVEARLNHLAQDARDRRGIRSGSPEQAALAADIRRTWAWPELIACGVLVVAYVVWLLA